MHEGLTPAQVAADQVLQWAIWQGLRNTVVMDGPQLQRLAKDISARLREAGVGLVEIDDTGHPGNDLEQAALGIALSYLAEHPRDGMRRRLAYVTHELAHRGWRKVVSAAALLSVVA